MSGRKLCRLCLNELLNTSTNNLYSSGIQTWQLLVNIFPGMNISLTNSIQLCEECFNNVNFANQVMNTFKEKEKHFLKCNYGSYSTRPYCSLCFKFETPEMIFIDKRQYSNEDLIRVIEIALTQLVMLSFNTNICGGCWSWVKRIYFFKKQCFKLEESLVLYCTRNRLQKLTDNHVENFLYEQYYVQNEYALYTKDDTVYLGNDIFNNTENHNLQEVEHEGKTVASQKPNYMNTEEISDSTTENSMINNNQTEIGSDDEFNETFERNFQNKNQDVVVILDDDEDIPNTFSDDIQENKICANKNEKSALDIFTEFTETELEDNQNYNNEVCMSSNTEVKLSNKKLDNLTNKEAILFKHDINNNNENLNDVINLIDEFDDDYVETVKSYVEITDNVGNNTNKSSNIIYCGTTQYSEVYEKYVSSSAKEPLYQVEEENKNNISEIDKENSTNIDLDIMLKGNDIIEDVSDKAPVLSLKHNVSQRIFKDNPYLFENNSVIAVNKKPILINDSTKENDPNDELLLLDDDCFEVVNERNNIIDMTNSDFHTNKSQATCQSNKSLRLQFNELWGCYICIAKYSQKKEIIRHLLTHEEPWNKYGRFQCRKCPFRASWKGTVTRHETLHTKVHFNKYFGKKILYLCPFCSNVYRERGDIQSHINEHVTSWNHFQCGECMFSTNVSKSLRQHYLKYHGPAKDPNFS